jgi:hypothetical protein
MYKAMKNISETNLSKLNDTLMLVVVVVVHLLAPTGPG